MKWNEIEVKTKGISISNADDYLFLQPKWYQVEA